MARPRAECWANSCPLTKVRAHLSADVSTSNGSEGTFNKIQDIVAGKYHTPSDDDDDSDGDGDIEILDGPPSHKSAGPSQRSSASRSSAAASSRQSASSKSDKKGTNKKTMKTYGGKHRARNIKTTGDDDGEVIDMSTITGDEDEEIDLCSDSDADRAPVKGKGKGPATGKRKSQTAKPAKSTSKGKRKAASGSLEDDPIDLDKDTSPDNTNPSQTGRTQTMSAAAGDATERTDTVQDVRMSPEPSNTGSQKEPSSNTGGDANMEDTPGSGAHKEPSSTTGGDSSARANEDKDTEMTPVPAPPAKCEF